MKHQRMLLNASNLHVGGGVQVATSVISELSLFADLPATLTVWASTEVDANLKSLECDLSSLPEYEVVDTYGLKAIFSPAIAKTRSFDRVFTIFGPLYSLFSKNFNIVGFAQPWIIYPNNEISKGLSFWRRITTRLKFTTQSFFFRKSDLVIVELEHVAKGLQEKGIAGTNNINIIYNCINSIYFDETKWKELPINYNENKIKLGFVGRNYKHKNTQLFPAIVSNLLEKHNIEAECYVTFNEDEWQACSDEFKKNVTNIGVLSIAQCPSFYKSMDAIIFPSLLECFSATPLEAMVMSKPLFASDRPFNHDICKDYAIYFDPLNAEDAANKIANYFLRNRDSPESIQILDEARQHALGFPNAKERAKQYLQYLIAGN
ncbi:glycosyltransferase [Pantoea sp. FN0302]|uniref:glycosyltransferase n=1 Tax=Pantoea sp. FN0302 TaxID=3418558 RepID=UPI003CED0388